MKLSLIGSQCLYWWIKLDQLKKFHTMGYCYGAYMYMLSYSKIRIKMELTNTDGSRDKNKVAAAAVLNKDVCFLLDSQMRRLNFFSKSKGNWTCFWAYRYVQIYTFTIYIFRFTFLFTCFHSMKIDRPYILDTLYTYCFVSNQGKIVNCCCIPSHIDIHGNMKQIRLQNLHSTSKILSIFYYTLYKLSLAYILGLL